MLSGLRPAPAPVAALSALLHGDRVARCGTRDAPAARATMAESRRRACLHNFMSERNFERKEFSTYTFFSSRMRTSARASDMRTVSVSAATGGMAGSVGASAPLDVKASTEKWPPRAWAADCDIDRRVGRGHGQRARAVEPEILALEVVSTRSRDSTDCGPNNGTVGCAQYSSAGGKRLDDGLSVTSEKGRVFYLRELDVTKETDLKSMASSRAPTSKEKLGSVEESMKIAATVAHTHEYPKADHTLALPMELTTISAASLRWAEVVMSTTPDSDATHGIGRFPWRDMNSTVSRTSNTAKTPRRQRAQPWWGMSEDAAADWLMQRSTAMSAGMSRTRGAPGEVHHPQSKSNKRLQCMSRCKLLYAALIVTAVGLSQAT
ncbi:hypothetical protein GGX14DRAFT_403431 [Mycena pura]|uniref:Uncharacterized protein n=1 Tax=Mycena pura TaxID=153505 RepID=A0AAD6UWB9_9AGAR|nr:hypothetical protein GGX14DRAFT_403431 [Mycena pura]